MSIRELAQIIAAETGFKGEIVWDTSKPDGQPRRALDVTRAAELFGFRARVNFAEGLRRTIEWYRASRRSAGSAPRD
jgi:GDP-L-fucose synthase